MRRLILLGLCLVLIAVACSGDEPPAPSGVTAAEGLRIEVVASGFEGPTQLAPVGDGRLVIGQLAGGENDVSGEVVVFSLNDAPDERIVLQSGLDKPTGVAVVGGQLILIERQRLSRTTLEPNAPLQVIVDDMPNNGRSQGALTPLPIGAVLFDTSGSKRGAERVEGSGELFALDPATDEVLPLATGFKHAYAQVGTDDGRLFTIEMTDGTFDGARGQDELVRLSAGDDGGWPYCVDDNVPVVEYGGTAELCDQSPRSHALFGAGATPTAVVVAPWDPGLLLVSLWIPGTIVSVPLDAADAPHEPVVVVDGLESPQSLVVDGDRVLVVDHGTGEILSLAPA